MHNFRYHNSVDLKSRNGSLSSITEKTEIRKNSISRKPLLPMNGRYENSQIIPYSTVYHFFCCGKPLTTSLLPLHLASIWVHFLRVLDRPFMMFFLSVLTLRSFCTCDTAIFYYSSYVYLLYVHS